MQHKPVFAWGGALMLWRKGREKGEKGGSEQMEGLVSRTNHNCEVHIPTRWASLSSGGYTRASPPPEAHHTLNPKPPASTSHCYDHHIHAYDHYLHIYFHNL